LNRIFLHLYLGSPAIARSSSATARSPISAAGTCIGSEKLVDVEFGPRLRVTPGVRADTQVAINGPVALRLDPGKLHLFEPASGWVIPCA